MWWCMKHPNPRPNENEPRDVAHIPFIENLGGARMHGGHAGADPCCQVEGQWRPHEPPFALCMQMVERCSTGNQAHKGLMTVAKQPGWEDGGHPFTTTYVIIPLLTSLC